MHLTKRQQEIYLYIKEHIASRGYAPSIHEIGERFGLSSPATVHKHLTNLENKGLIRRRQHQSRALELGEDPRRDFSALSSFSQEFVLLGNIAAGRPIEALENRETVSFLPDAADKDVFALRVRGDSMINDHIQDGDYVIVERRDHAENGDMVVALLDNENATLKRLYREKGGVVRLQPANPNMKPIHVKTGDFKIQGVVVGVMRKFK